MKFKILETNESKELKIMVNGINVIDDTIYIDEFIAHDDEENIYIVAQSDYNTYEDIANLIQSAEDLRAELSDDEKTVIDDWCFFNFGSDIHENAKMAYEYITIGGYKE